MDHQDRLKPFTISQLQSCDPGSAQSVAHKTIGSLSGQAPLAELFVKGKKKSDPVISMRKKSYDEMLSREPAAALTYLDEDDGDTIRVRDTFFLFYTAGHGSSAVSFRP